MTAALATNRGPATRCGTQSLRGHWDRVAQTVRELFPHKTAYHLSELTGLRLRAAEYFLSRKTGLSSDALVSLLQSEQGIDALAALMGDARPGWWRRLKAAAMRERVQREIEDLERELKAIDDDYAAQAPSARRHQAVCEMGQAGASAAPAKATLLKGQAR